MENLTQSDGFRELGLILAHWPYWAPLVLVILTVAGRVGRGLGAPNLFRDDDQLFNSDGRWGDPPSSRSRPPALARVPGPVWRAGASPALWGAFGYLAAFGLFWIAAHAPPIGGGGADGFCFSAGAPTPCRTEIFRAGATGGGYLALALVAAAVAYALATHAALGRPRADFTRLPARRRISEMARAGVGLKLGAAFVLVAYGLGAAGFATLGRAAALAGAALPYFGVLVVVGTRPSALPAVSIASLIFVLILVGIPLSRLGGAWTPFWAAAAVGAIVWANGAFAKRRLPGFEALYDDPLNPQARPPADEPPPFPQPPLLDPAGALRAWRDNPGRPGPAGKPILVLVATSGGAYRAGFWTGIILDALIGGSGHGGRWPGLAGSVRLVTGASGGMVAGAYFAAMAAEGRLDERIVDRISRDTVDRMGDAAGCDRNQPIARDSLSPVVHQLVRRDLPSLFLPWRPPSDRGRTLDAQWRTLATRTYADLAASESAGVAPSLILSPMLVETGAVALFTNLDLDNLRRTEPGRGAAGSTPNKATVEIFKVFGGAHARVSLATAVRLNATFPYVSPAISLPTMPDRRPVDAGYYDNYGIDLLTGYLDQDDILAFARDHCRGVAVIEIRAFPSGRMTMAATLRQRAFHFLTSPVEGVFAARQSSQMFRNDQQLAGARRRYAEATGDADFLRVFTFEANTDVSMSWYLRCDEMRALAALVRRPARAELVWGAVAPPDAGGGGALVENREEVERWVVLRYGEDPDKVRTPDAFVKDLQARDPAALRAQQLHHRAKIADELAALESFWDRAATPAPEAEARLRRDPSQT